MNGKKLYWSVFFSLIIIYVFVGSLCVWLLFENILVCCILILTGLPFFVILLKRYLEKKKQSIIEMEFYKMLGSVSASMASGMILENALKETIIVDKKEYKILSSDFEKMYRMLQNNYTIEGAFKLLAQKYNNREIKTFCDVLSAGRPTGIDMTALIRYMSSAYRTKADAYSEIVRILNAPKYNNRLIMAMPFVCIFIFRQMAPSYMSSLYTHTGNMIMLFVSILIIFSCWLGEKIGNINY